MIGWTTRIRRAVALGATALAVWAGPAQANPAQAGAWQPSEDDALLLELHSGQYKIGDALRGYQTPDGVCVDFADLVQDCRSKRNSGAARH